MNEAENRQVITLAAGRIFRMMSRPFQEGDIEEFGRCRSIILNAADALNLGYETYRPNYARDRMQGAQGD